MDQLLRSGIRTRLTPAPRKSPIDLVLEVIFKDERHCFAVEVKNRAPYPGELEVLAPKFKEAAELGSPLLAAPYISEALAHHLARRGWSWSDEAGNYDLIGDRFRLSRRTTTKPPPPKRQRALLPQGAGALAIIRFLIVRGGQSPFGATELANIAGVTQPRASQVLARLHQADLLHRTMQGPHEPDREALLDAFLNEYRGPRGSEFPFYSLDPPQEVAKRFVSLSGKPTVAMSADVGPDLIAAWRAPTHLIVYARRHIKTASLGLTPAHSRDDANVLLRVPIDTSVLADWHPIFAELDSADIRLADPTQMMWDLHDLGGDDRAEAAGELKSWILRPR
ncbi:MAG: hypothetical protein ACREV8_01760 [Gammaproteobacteria bacterium]